MGLLFSIVTFDISVTRETDFCMRRTSVVQSRAPVQYEIEGNLKFENIDVYILDDPRYMGPTCNIGLGNDARIDAWIRG